MKSQAIKCIVAVLASLMLVACGGGDQPDGKAQSEVPQSSVAAQPASSRDGADPNESGCSSTAVTVTGSVSVKLPDGRDYGQLVLRRSTACRTIWGRVEGIIIPGIDVHVSVVRPADNARRDFHTPDGTPEKPVFGNMLSYTTGCVYAEAFVPGGPVAQTDCLES